MQRLALQFTPVVALGAMLMAAVPARAVTYVETGDAGNQIATSQNASATVNLTAIQGSLTNGDADLFQILITNPATFSATMTLAAGQNNFDSQLFLINSGGFGVILNDDDPTFTNTPASRIPAGSISALMPGIFYLGVTPYDLDPTSTSGLIFPDADFVTVQKEDVVGPTGPGGGSPLSGYTGTGNDSGAYLISLTGVTPVPEPSTVGLLLGAGALVSAAGLRKRRGNGNLSSR